jgi:hypothetical protein
MTTPPIKRLLLTILSCLSLASAACAGSSDYMAEIKSPPPIAAPADKAGVVFVRPSGLGFAINFAILDQNGNWVGDAVAKAHFVVTLPPGEYLFVGWAENTAALKATLAAGRTYYVEVTPTVGFGSAHVVLEAVTPRSSDWSELDAWLKETKRLEPLPKGTVYHQGRRDDALKRLASARENWDGYSADEKAKRTLRAEDGVPSATAVTPSAASVSAAPPGVASPPAQPIAAPPPSPPVATAPPAPGACGKDTECKGDRICQAGQCTAPTRPR